MKHYDNLTKRIKPLWDKYWELIIVAVFAFLIGAFILPLVLK